jgi:quercetin dioxygenase-like cupin family protein
MHVISPTPERIHTTPNATMTALATPSRGSTALATWHVRMEPGQSGPVHTIDREQVWTVLSGSLRATCEGRTEEAGPGQAVLVPPGVPRQFATAGGPVEALVVMEAGGVALLENGEERTLPWAE